MPIPPVNPMTFISDRKCACTMEEKARYNGPPLPGPLLERRGGKYIHSTSPKLGGHSTFVRAHAELCTPRHAIARVLSLSSSGGEGGGEEAVTALTRCR